MLSFAVLYRYAARLASLAVLLTSLVACTSSPTSKNLEQTFAADPRLKDNPVTFGPTGSSQPNKTTVQLPANFPAEIPIYPNAQLQDVVTPSTTQGFAGGSSGNSRAQAQGGQSASSLTTGDSQLTQSTRSQVEVPPLKTLTRWISPDPSHLIEEFYQKQFQTNNWQILSQPTAASNNTIEARRDNLQVSVSIQPQPTPSSSTPSQSQPATKQDVAATTFVIQYSRSEAATAPAPTATTTPQPSASNPAESLSGGPLRSELSKSVAPPTVTAAQPSPTPDTQPARVGDSNFTDLNQVPPEYRQYVSDLAKLGALPLNATDKSNKSATGTQFDPNKIISRREFARWLFTANNIIHSTTPAQQIHAASPTDRPAFQDVPATDPDFPIIQGLAEAGLIPSPLSGDDTAVLFRPDAPLTREQMILEKVPLDTHQALPNASVDAVKQTWGFQDAARINPLALKAVLADFQNGDRSNIRRVFGYTTLFQPQKPVTRAEAAACLWYFGTQSDGLSAKDVLKIKSQQSQQATTSPSPTSSANP
ncbi:MAG: S-layer homology domain-containing protein [Chroococcidiopsidaceae cyanobacterium CP_BM_ER_R8_30]|nr:S-layer homology domain-containing protein [Chroococcidiopsidaceae cyanobacterium CP_BM_ER_R8_30]